MATLEWESYRGLTPPLVSIDVCICRLTMVEKNEASPMSKAALTALVAGSLFVGGMPPAEASINSQVSQSLH